MSESELVRLQLRPVSAARYEWQPGDGTRYDFLVAMYRTPTPFGTRYSLTWLNGPGQESWAPPMVWFTDHVDARQLVLAYGWRAYDAAAICTFMHEVLGVTVAGVDGLTPASPSVPR